MKESGLKNISNFHTYSVGIVTSDKEIDKDIIEVYPLELMYDRSGYIDDVESVIETIQLADNNLISVNVNKTLTVKAEWKPTGNSNRVTSPNVKKGETVFLYQFADVDQFFWDTLGIAPNIRRKERVVHMYGNTDETDTELSGDTSYWFEISTIDKILRLHTSDNDGEKTTFDIELDTLSGILKLVDGRDCSLVYDSDTKEFTLTMVNKINLVTDEFNLKASNNAFIDVGDVLKINLDKVSVANDTCELIQTLSDTLQGIIDESHIGNLGIPTKLHPASITTFTELKTKIDSLIG